MKKYEKPILTAISLSGNDQLCGSCGGTGYIKLKEDPALAEMIVSDFQLDVNKNGIPDAGDFSSTFTTAETDCTIKKEVYGFCKFTAGSSDSLMIAWS